VDTVAILPFEAIGAGSEQTYLAHGIRSDLMTDLSRLSGLRVVSTSGGIPSSPTPAGVSYFASGSMQRDVAGLRVNARLNDARNHEQLWSQRVERPFGDLFAIHNDISHGPVAQLPGKINDALVRRIEWVP
jgi:adenylate cyclase